MPPDDIMEKLLRNNPYKEVPKLPGVKLEEIAEISRITQVDDFSPEGDADGKSLKWPMVSKAVLIRDGYSCRVCGRSDFTNFSTADQYNKVHLAVQVHHITPRKKGGKDTFRNLITLCEECHRKTFSNDYSGLPVSGQTSIYGFEKRIALSLRPEWERLASRKTASGILRDHVRAFDTGSNRYRVVPKKGENIQITVADLSLAEYSEICRVANSESNAVDYITMFAETERGREKVRFYISGENEIIV